MSVSFAGDRGSASGDAAPGGFSFFGGVHRSTLDDSELYMMQLDREQAARRRSRPHEGRSYGSRGDDDDASIADEGAPSDEASVDGADGPRRRRRTASRTNPHAERHQPYGGGGGCR